MSWLPRLPFPLPATAAEAHSVIYASENFQDGVALGSIGSSWGKAVPVLYLIFGPYSLKTERTRSKKGKDLNDLQVCFYDLAPASILCN